MTTPTYKQPHEGVTGVDRSDNDLLSLDASAVVHRLAIATLAKHLHDAVMVGNPAPVVERMWQRIREPRVGDFVLEWAMYRRGGLDQCIKAMGYLVEKRTEWWSTDEEYEREVAEELAWHVEHGRDPAEFEADERMTDVAWYIQYGQDARDICRWTNCSFIVVPIDSEAFTHPIGTPTPTGGVVITSDSLLAGMADSGFVLNLPPRGES
jgi:hypothetical protein